MSYARITINGTIELDQNLGEWQAVGPEFLKKMIKPESKAHPHIMAIGVVLSSALLVGKDIAIDVIINEDESEWTMSVNESLAIALPAGDGNDPNHIIIGNE